MEEEKKGRMMSQMTTVSDVVAFPQITIIIIAIAIFIITIMAMKIMTMMTLEITSAKHGNKSVWAANESEFK